MKYGWVLFFILVCSGIIQAQEGETAPNAEELFEETTQLPNMPQTMECYVGDDAFDRHLEEAALRSGQQRLDEAYPHYQCATQLKPDSWIAWRGVGVVLMNYGNYEVALRVFQAAIDLNPYESSLFYYQGYTQTQLELYQAAVLSLSRAIELNPNYTIAYNWRGVVYQKLGEPEKAIQDLQLVVSLGYPLPYRYTPYVNLANLYLDVYNDPRQAITWFEGAVNIAPNEAFLHKILGDLYLKQDETDMAEIHYTRYMEISMYQIDRNVMNELQQATLRRAILRYLPTLLVGVIVVGYFSTMLWARVRLRIYEHILKSMGGIPPIAPPDNAPAPNLATRLLLKPLDWLAQVLRPSSTPNP